MNRGYSMDELAQAIFDRLPEDVEKNPEAVADPLGYITKLAADIDVDSWAGQRVNFEHPMARSYIESYIASLSPRLKVILELHMKQGLDHKQIAKGKKWPEGMVLDDLTHIYRQLQEQLRKRYPGIDV